MSLRRYDICAINFDYTNFDFEIKVKLLLVIYRHRPLKIYKRRSEPSFSNLQLNTIYTFNEVLFLFVNLVNKINRLLHHMLLLHVFYRLK